MPVAALTLVICGGSLPLHARSTTPEATTSASVYPQVTAPTCVAPPKIDGVLDDECWKSATHIAQFYRQTSAIVQPTEGFICCDRTHLYVAFHCYDSQPELIKATETQRNGNTGSDDGVVLFVDSQNTRHSFSQFTVTANGTQSETLEGGTANNITWAGDWRVAARRNSLGWDAEISIPFALLRYPKGAHSFAIALARKLARETSAEFWPDIPPTAVNPAEYFANLTGLPLHFQHTRPIFLQYSLITAGSGNSKSAGLDIKYPLTGGLTSLVTIHPDFGTVEQNVTDINFSYTQKFISDQRPFFAEGAGYLPGSDIFYSPSIGNIDGGLKLTGKEKNTSIGVLTTYTGWTNNQRASVMRISQDLNPLSSLIFDFAGDSQSGLTSNQAGRITSNFGWHMGRGTLTAAAAHTTSWKDGKRGDGDDSYSLGFNGGKGHPSFGWGWSDIGQNYAARLGYVPYTNIRGSNYSLDQFNSFDNGYLQNYDVNASYAKNDYHTGGFFQDILNAGISINTRPGNGLSFSFSQGRHLQFRDHVNSAALSWSNNAIYAGGYVSVQMGTQEDKHSRYFSIGQGYAPSRRMNFSLNVNHLDFGSQHTTQAVLAPQYRLTTERAIGGRIVSQNNDMDIYMSYAQKVRAGTDVYLLFGDPNSARTRGIVQMKWVTPF